MNEKNSIKKDFENNKKDRTIGDRLVEWRENKKIKSIDLSKKTGIPQTTISKIESNLQQPSSVTLARILETTDINIGWLLTGKGPMLLHDKIQNEVSKVLSSKIIEDNLTLRDVNASYKSGAVAFIKTDAEKNEIRNLLDQAWDNANKDERGWLRAELKALFQKFHNFIKNK